MVKKKTGGGSRRVAKKASRAPKRPGTPVSLASERSAVQVVPPKLSEAEQDLVWHMEQGNVLETDSLGSDVVLRNLKDNSVVRPASANRSTIEALGKRGLIAPVKSRDPLRIVWRLNKKS
jgi:hypothetical protein